ncbi:MAG: Gfo/Idh/MocA family protein, partial [Candidatus Caldatribacteriaceae bacterium]
DAFSLWVRGKEVAEIHYQIGLRNLAVLEAIYRSQEEGKVVKVNV